MTDKVHLPAASDAGANVEQSGPNPAQREVGTPCDRECPTDKVHLPAASDAGANVEQSGPNPAQREVGTPCDRECPTDKVHLPAASDAGANVFLGPGSEFPQWLCALEELAFHNPWKKLGDRECLWAIPQQGYAQWSLTPEIQEAELLRIAVAPEARGAGLGRRLLRKSVASLKNQSIAILHLEVRLSNAAARHLYESEGWRLVGIRRRYYRDGEDAALYDFAIHP